MVAAKGFFFIPSEARDLLPSKTQEKADSWGKTRPSERQVVGFSATCEAGPLRADKLLASVDNKAKIVPGPGLCN